MLRQDVSPPAVLTMADQDGYHSARYGPELATSDAGVLVYNGQQPPCRRRWGVVRSIQEQ